MHKYDLIFIILIYHHQLYSMIRMLINYVIYLLILISKYMYVLDVILNYYVLLDCLSVSLNYHDYYCYYYWYYETY